MRIKLKIFLFILFLLAPLRVYAAQTLVADSCSKADIKTKYDLASPGDTVAIPASDTACTWDAADTITLDKEITILGAGILPGNLTKIIHDQTSSNVCTFRIALTTDVPVKVSGIYFAKSQSTPNDKIAICVVGSGSDSYVLTKIAITGNHFYGGNAVVSWSGASAGVVARNFFTNTNIGVRVSGDQNYAWARAIEAGNDYSGVVPFAVYVEGNTFIHDANSTNGGDGYIYHQAGGRSVTRHNKFDATLDTTHQAQVYDTHGNWNYSGTDHLQMRGQPLVEFYKNTIATYSSGKHMFIRGGSLLAFSNMFSSVTGTSNPFYVTDEEAWTGGGVWCPSYRNSNTAYALNAQRTPYIKNGYTYRVITAGTSGSSTPTWPTGIGQTVTDGTVVWINEKATDCMISTEWPGGDQIFNSFFWDNTYCVGSGCIPVAVTDIFIESAGAPTYVNGYSDALIQKNRDYFMHKPCAAGDSVDELGNSCTHGKETLATVTTYNKVTNDFLGNKMSFSDTGDNAYYPYVEFTCPYPGITGIVCTSAPGLDGYVEVSVGQKALSVVNSGYGIVTSSPAGIDCRSVISGQGGYTACGLSFDTGTEVTLTFTPDQYYRAGVWSGDGTGTTTRVVTMSADSVVNVTNDAIVFRSGGSMGSGTMQ